MPTNNAERNAEEIENLEPEPKENYIIDKEAENGSTISPRLIHACFPFQRDILPDDFPVHQYLTRKTLSFQNHWFKQFPWLHVAGFDGIGCFYCIKYFHMSPEKTLASKANESFYLRGFKNWKKSTREV